jgi:hypothetical protein
VHDVAMVLNSPFPLVVDKPVKDLLVEDSVKVIISDVEKAILPM